LDWFKVWNWMRNQIAVFGVFSVCAVFAVFKDEATKTPAHGETSGRGWAENLVTWRKAEPPFDQTG
jgi:hypothetical protein